MANLAKAIEGVQEMILTDQFHHGDELTIEVDQTYTLEEEGALYEAALDALEDAGCLFVRIRMTRPVSA